MLALLLVGSLIAVVVALVVVALVLTLYLPLTVSWIGDLDWGPVVGGYLAALLVASAYAAIGLFVSARTDNQIVALMGAIDGSEARPTDRWSATRQRRRLAFAGDKRPRTRRFAASRLLWALRLRPCRWSRMARSARIASKPIAVGW